MLKKDITYTNFDDESVTETFYFHLSQVELLRWESDLQATGGLNGYFEETMKSNDGGKIMRFMEDFISRAIGRKSPDGSRFEKSPEIKSDFTSSLAYDTFFMGLVTDPEEAAKFMNGIVPKELAENVEKLSKLEQVKANVDDRRATSGPLAEEREVMRNPDGPIADPSQGGNVFTPGLAPDGSKPEPRVLTRAEVQEMDHDELASGLASGIFVIGSE